MSEARARESMTVLRPILFNSAAVRAVLDGSKSVTRRPVVVARSITSIPRGHLTDLGRAWADRGFPLDHDNKVMPMGRWGATSADPAPESAYRNSYLHVPFAHPGDGWEADPADDTYGRVYCPLGAPGDRLWVRETFAALDMDPKREASAVLHLVRYRADHGGGPGSGSHGFGKWKPSIHMPRWASRITLRVVSVRPERLHSITGRDIVAEGIPPPGPEHDPKVLRDDFARLWDGIYKGRPGLGWDDSPWVWVVSFRRIDRDGR